MQIKLSATDLSACLRGAALIEGEITLTIEDPEARARILALLLPCAASPPRDATPTDPLVCLETSLTGVWQCGDILEGPRGLDPILVGRDGRWVGVLRYDRAEDLAPRVWHEARAFEDRGPFRRIGYVDPAVVQRVLGGDEEAAATIVRTAYPPAEG